MRLLIAVCVITLSPSPAFADPLTPELAAKIDHDQKVAREEINKKHGNRKPSEMDTDERRQVIEETATAQQGVLDKYGVSAKDYARYVALMPMDDRKREAEALDKLNNKDPKEP